MQRLGLRRIDKDNESKFARPLLTIMQDHQLDFHGTFRRLCFFKPSIASSDVSAAADPSSRTPMTTFVPFTCVSHAGSPLALAQCGC